MKRRWWALLVVVGLALIAASGLYLARPTLQREVAHRLEGDLAALAGTTAAVDGLEIGLFPPRLAAARLLVGPEAAPALDLSDLSLDFDVLAWAAAIRVDAIRIGVDHWTGSTAQGGGGGFALPAWLPSLALSVGEVEVDATAGGVPGHLHAGGCELSLARRLGGFSAEVRANVARLDHGDESLGFSAIDAAADLDRRGITLRSAHLESDAGAVVTGVARDVTPGQTPLEVHLDLDRLSRFLALDEPLSGNLTWSGDVRFPLSGALDDLAAAGRLHVESLAVAAVRARSFETDLDFRQGRVQLRDLTLVADEARVTGAADVSLHSPYPLRLEVAAEGAAWIPALHDVLSSGPASARVNLAGDLAPLSLAGSIAADVAALRRLVPAPASKVDEGGLDAHLAADFRQVEKGTEVEGSLHLASTGGSAADAGSADFRVRLAGDGAVSGTAKLRVADARRLRPLLPAAGGGIVDGDVAFDGTLDSPHLEGRILGTDLILAGTRFERLGGSFEAAPDSVVAKPIELEAVGGLARLEGRIGLAPGARNDWKLVLQHLDLATLWIALDSAAIELPYLTGAVDGEATASGAWGEGELSARVLADKVNVGTEHFSSMALRLEAKAQKWSVDGEVLRRADEALRLAGAGTGLGSMWLSAWSTSWDVAAFRFLDSLPERHGQAVFSANLYGSLEAPLGTARLDVSGLHIGERQIGTFTAEATAMPQGVVQIYLGDTEERLAVQGTVRAGGDRAFSLAARLRDFDLANFLAPQQAATLVTEGTAAVSGRLGDPARSLNGEITLPRFEVGREALAMKAPAPIVIRARDGRLQIVSFKLEGDFGTIEVGGGLGLDGDVAVDVRADVDARVAEAIPKSPVRWASGTASLEAHVRRPAGGAPNLDGHGSVQQLAIDLGLPFLLSDTNGGFVLEGSRITLQDLRGQAGGGDFVLGGYVDLAAGPHLLWQVTEMNSGFLDWLEDEVSGKGEIRGTWDETVVAGEVSVLSALYDRDVSLADLLPVFRRNLGPTPPKPGEKAIGLDLHIVAPDSVFIDNNVAKAEFRTDLNIEGTDLEPRLRGEVELLEGQATIFDRRFEITLGRVAFDGRPKINPRLEFSANTDVSTPEGEYNIVAEVTGTLDDPRIKLAADDRSLTTNDIATLLTMGKTMAQLESEGSGLSAGSLTSLAPALYGSQVQRGVQEFLPIDRFSLEPGFSRVTGEFEPKVTVGSELARNLRGTLSTTVGVQTQNSVTLEYQLTPRTVVVGSWESRTETSAGGFGGGVKFRWRFRYPPRYTLLPPGWWSRN